MMLLRGIKGALSGLWGYVATAGIALSVLLAVYTRGRSDGADREKMKDLKRNEKARERMDDVETPVGNADVTDWLRDRAKR